MEEMNLSKDEKEILESEIIKKWDESKNENNHENIIKRKKAEEKLRANQTRHYSIVEDISALICCFKPDGSLTFVNNYYCNYFNKKKKELIGENWFQFIPEKNKERIKKHFQSLTQKKPAITYEHQVITPSKKICWQRWTDKAIYDKNGILLEYQSIGIDITERKKAEEEIRKLAKLPAENPNPVMRIDIDGKLVYSNKTAKPFVKTFFEGTMQIPDYCKQTIKEAIQKNRQKECIIECKGKIYSFIIAPINSSYVNLYGRDITEQKKAELEKEELTEKLAIYAKRLEIKLKRLERNKIKLTEKEKLVFYAITKHPDMTDQQLSEKIKIKRSTVTAIKNRLKQKKLFEVVNIPNFEAIGCELLSIVYGKLNIPSKLKEKEIIIPSYPENVFTQATDTEYISGIVSNNIVEFQKTTDWITNQKTKIFKEIRIIHFPFELNKILKLFDYSELIKKMFKIEIQEEEQNIPITSTKVKLSSNEKKVLYSLVKYPELPGFEIADKIDLTIATVNKIKKQLKKEGTLITKNIPKINKLGWNLIVFFHAKLKQGINTKKIKELTPYSIFIIEGEKEITGLCMFKNYEEYKTIKNTKKLKELLIEETTELKMAVKNLKIINMNYAPLTKKVLGLEKLDI